MKRYTVTLPIAGTAYVEVDANSEQEAIQNAMEAVTIDDIEEWEALAHILEGNVCHAPTWDAEATEQDDA